MKPVITLSLRVAAALLLCVTAALADDGLDTQVDIAYERFQLDNGLTVLVHTDHSTPTVFVGMWYGVGSKDEPEGRTGFAHLFEHLMFQGTANRDGEYFSPFTDAGATGMNGTTSEDRTNYYATVPTGALDMALWMESDRMTYLLGAITQEALDEQRGVVQNEKRQSENRPYSGMRERIKAGLYPVDHPYRHTIIGSMDDLDAASVEDVTEWFNTYYGASNVVLVLAGDVDIETAKEKVAYYFGEAPAGEPLVHAKKWIPNLVENREEVMYDRVGQTRIARVWALPDMNEKDSTLMYLVNDSLVANKNSPLRRILVDELKLATRVSGSVYGRVLSGEYTLSIDLREGVAPEQVLPIVDRVLAEYLREGPDEQIVENAKLAVNMYMLGALESNASIGRLLVEGELYSDDPLYINQELEWLNAATAAELTETANLWLTRGYYQLTVLPFPDMTVAEPQADRSTIPAVETDSEINFPVIETATLDNGMALVVAKRGSVPLIDVSISIDTGAAAAPADAPGLGTFMFALMDKGTRHLDANELAAEKDRIAMASSFRNGLERSSLGWRILTPYLGDSLEIAADMMQNPEFPDEELEKIKAQLAAYLANVAVNPTGVANSLFERAIYGEDNPMGGIWTPELAAQVNREKLQRFHEQEVTPDQMTVYMIGDIDMATAKDAVESAFGRWRDTNQSSLKPVGSAPEPRPRVVLVDHPGAVQSVIFAGHTIDPFDASINTELSVMNAIFGGTFESRINMNLREDKAWSYGMRSGINQNRSGDQYLAVSGSVQSDKTMESMQEILKEYQDFLVARPATETEVERIKLNMTRSLPGMFATNRGFLSSMITSDSYGLPFDYAEQRGERLAEITVDGVIARAKAVIEPSKLTWLVVGDLEQIEENVRSLDLGEVEVWDAFGKRLR